MHTGSCAKLVHGRHGVDHERTQGIPHSLSARVGSATLKEEPQHALVYAAAGRQQDVFKSALAKPVFGVDLCLGLVLQQQVHAVHTTVPSSKNKGGGSPALSAAVNCAVGSCCSSSRTQCAWPCIEAQISDVSL
eukprot:365889-Chlamydomonas_euryale.AAC.11